MNCERVTELLQSYFDGELEPELAEQVAAGIESCPHCQDEFALLVQMREAIREPILRELDEVSFQGLWERIDAQLVAQPAARAVLPTHAATSPTRDVTSPAWGERFTGWLAAFFARPAFVAAIGVCAVALVVYSLTRDSNTSQDRPSGSTEGIAAANDGTSNAEPPNNLAFVSSVTVSSGSVFIDQDPSDPEAPVIVWHIEDEEEPEQPSPQGG
ncbi:MAG: zf-HC2 domain-containing protein [Myxococcales bacterium]|nr:zf-HC2 domain-containing protein [Myxococcales bacterium]